MTALSIGDLALVTRSAIAGVLVFTVLGIVGDLRPAGHRTRARLADGSDASGGPLGVIGRTADAARIFIDELTPGGRRARRAADDERTRVGTMEIHADIVPLVRRALWEAEHGGSPERLALALRDVLAEVDGLASDRHSVALDELGLLPAIEWLAERTEERSARSASASRSTVRRRPGLWPRAGAAPAQGTSRRQHFGSPSSPWRTSSSMRRLPPRASD